MKFIDENPFRILGVITNASAKILNSLEEKIIDFNNLK